MTAGILMPSYYPAVSFDPPGSVTLSTRGAWSFVVPNFRDSLEIELIGAGAGGGGAGSSGGTFGGTGGDTTCPGLGMTAGGGKGGAGASGTNNAGGAGGTASGGDTNTPGGAGGNSTSSLSGVGGNAPNGGIGGTGVTTNNTRGNDGGPPGGGGSGGKGSPNPGGGGGAGARSVKTFARGALVPGSTLSGVIGQGGAGYSGSAARGGDGADGQVKITWSGGAAPPAELTEISFVTSASSAALGSSVTCPATQPGDILIFAQWNYVGSNLAAYVTPTGFTPTGAATYSNAARAILFHKVADGTEGGTTLSGLSGNGTYGVVVLVFRGNVPVTGIIPNDVNTKTAGPGVASSHTILSGAGSSPLLAVGACVVAGSQTISFSPQTGRVNVNSGAGAVCYDIQNSITANAVMSATAANPGLSAIVGSYYTFTT